MKTHAVITYTKVHYLITDEQNRKLQNCRLDDEIELDGCQVKVKNIADVLTLSKYYEVYPDKRPQYVDKYKQLPGMGYKGIIKRAPGYAVQEMIKGIKKFLSNKKPGECPNAEELLKIMELKIN